MQLKFMKEILEIYHTKTRVNCQLHVVTSCIASCIAIAGVLL